MAADKDEGLKVKVDQLEAVGLDAAEADIIRDGIMERHRIKRAMDLLEVEKEAVNLMLMAVMGSSNIRTVSDPVLGAVDFKKGINRSLNKDKITNSMLSHDIDAETINTVIKEGTTETPYETIEFRAIRTKKGKG